MPRNNTYPSLLEGSGSSGSPYRRKDLTSLNRHYYLSAPTTRPSFTKIPGFLHFSETKVARQAKNRGVPSLRKVMDEFLNSVKFLACWVPNLARIWVSLLSLPLLTSLLSSHRAVRSRIFLRHGSPASVSSRLLSFIQRLGCHERSW